MRGGSDFFVLYNEADVVHGMPVELRIPEIQKFQTKICRVMNHVSSHE